MHSPGSETGFFFLLLLQAIGYCDKTALLIAQKLVLIVQACLPSLGCERATKVTDSFLSLVNGI